MPKTIREADEQANGYFFGKCSAARWTAVDTDFIARLCDVYPDDDNGPCHLLSQRDPGGPVRLVLGQFREVNFVGGGDRRRHLPEDRLGEHAEDEGPAHPIHG